MEITLHHLNQSRSHRILWVLEELGLGYKVVRYQRNAQTMLAPPELTQVHPLGKSPVVTIKEGEKTIVLAESGAILEYLCGRFSTPMGLTLVPPLDSEAHLRYSFWLHFAEGSAAPMLLLKLIFDKVERGPWLVRPVLKQVSEKVKNTLVLPTLEKQLNYIEAELGKADWLAGEQFSAADIQMGYVVEAAASRVGLKAHPRIQSYLERIQKREAYQRAVARDQAAD